MGRHLVIIRGRNTSDPIASVIPVSGETGAEAKARAIYNGRDSYYPDPKDEYNIGSKAKKKFNPSTDLIVQVETSTYGIIATCFEKDMLEEEIEEPD